MILDNTFDVDLSVDEAWKLLQDLERIAPCLPGATLDEVVDGEFRGSLSARIGPVTARYRGTARFVELDHVAHRAVIKARGREERGSGAANLTVSAALEPSGDGTTVHLSTDMAISGRAAQFGRSLLAEVSAGLIQEFTQRLEALVAREAGGGAGSTARPAAPDTQDEAAALDVGRTILLPVLRRALVPACAALSGMVAGWLLGRRGKGSPSRGGRR
ncbi:SRPBCC family protein [Streptomyces sp. MMG1533]|uniref:SRPBCC family protein n=1 Tax=Streptomyces sp. MMG1533 TaxID=1415546 RepID=UPI0006AFD841|nr:SRPBCC family protein [Streptomyces sp. MMG1533]